jgi:hypothetical protein
MGKSTYVESRILTSMKATFESSWSHAISIFGTLRRGSGLV